MICVVQKPFTGPDGRILPSGTVVDTTAVRNETRLIGSRYLRHASEQEIAAALKADRLIVVTGPDELATSEPEQEQAPAGDGFPAAVAKANVTDAVALINDCEDPAALEAARDADATAVRQAPSKSGARAGVQKAIAARLESLAVPA